MKRQPLILLFIVVNLLAIRGLCQNSVSGSVHTNENIQLPFATVTLYADSVAIQSVVCDSSGRFMLLYPKSIQEYNSAGLRLRAFYRQFSSDLISIPQNNDQVHLIINDPSKLLSAVVVEADVSRVSRRGDRFVFVPAKYLTRGSDAFDVLRHVPLIKVDDQSDAFSIINKSATTIYVNNKKSDIPKEMMMQMLRSMPAENIISIEVITNPGSEYAANITGGIININLKRAFRDGWQGSLTALSEQTGFNTSMLNGGVTYRKEKFAINIIPFVNRSFNYYKLKNEVTDINGNTASYNTNYTRKYLVLGGGINMDYQFSPRSYFGIKYWQTNVSGRPSLNTSARQIKSGIAEDINSYYKGRDSYLYNFGNANFRYNVDSNGRSYIDINVDFNRFRQKRTLEGFFQRLDASNNLFNTFGEYRNILPQHFWNFSAQADYKKTLSAKSSLLFGVQTSHTNVNNNLQYYNIKQSQATLNDELSQDYSYREDYQAAYISASSNFSNKFSGSASLRAERTDYESVAEKTGTAYDSVYYNLYPSLSASYYPSQKHQFGYSLSRKIIRPNIESLYPARIYRSENYFVENNPFLQPTLLFVNELSYLYNRRYSFSVTYSATKNSNARFVIPFIDTTLKFKETLLNYGTIRQVSIVFNTNFNFFKGKWQLYITPYYNHVVYSGHIAGRRVHVVNNDLNLIADNYFQLSKNRTWAGFLTYNFNGPTRDISAERINTLSSLTVQLRKTIKKFTLSVIASDIYNGKSRTKSNLYANYLLSGNYADRLSYTRAIQFKVRYGFGNNNLTGTRNRNTANQDIRNRSN